MDKRNPTTAGRVYEDFQPSLDWTREPESDTLRVYLPAFKREQLRIQLETDGNLKISGERPLTANRSSRFSRGVPLPDNCNTSEIRAWFDNNGSLYVTCPKTIESESIPEQTTPTKESPKSPKIQQRSDSETGRDGSVAKPPSTTTVKETTGVKPPSTATGKETTGAKPPSTATGKETTGAEPPSTATGKETTGEKPTSTATDKESTSATAFAEKQKNGSTDALNATDHEIKKAEDEKETSKMVDPSTKTAVGGELGKESYMHGVGGWVLGMDESRQLMVNVVVAFLVFFALLMYISNKFASKE